MEKEQSMSSIEAQRLSKEDRSRVAKRHATEKLIILETETEIDLEVRRVKRNEYMRKYYLSKKRGEIPKEVPKKKDQSEIQKKNEPIKPNRRSRVRKLKQPETEEEAKIRRAKQNHYKQVYLQKKKLEAQIAQIQIECQRRAQEAEENERIQKQKGKEEAELQRPKKRAYNRKNKTNKGTEEAPTKESQKKKEYYNKKKSESQKALQLRRIEWNQKKRFYLERKNLELQEAEYMKKKQQEVEEEEVEKRRIRMAERNRIYNLRRQEAEEAQKLGVKNIKRKYRSRKRKPGETTEVMAHRSQQTTRGRGSGNSPRRRVGRPRVLQQTQTQEEPLDIKPPIPLNIDPAILNRFQEFSNYEDPQSDDEDFNFSISNVNEESPTMIVCKEELDESSIEVELSSETNRMDPLLNDYEIWPYSITPPPIKTEPDSANLKPLVTQFSPEMFPASSAALTESPNNFTRTRIKNELLDTTTKNNNRSAILTSNSDIQANTQESSIKIVSVHSAATQSPLPFTWHMNNDESIESTSNPLDDELTEIFNEKKSVTLFGCAVPLGANSGYTNQDLEKKPFSQNIDSTLTSNNNVPASDKKIKQIYGRGSSESGSPLSFTFEDFLASLGQLDDESVGHDSEISNSEKPSHTLDKLINIKCEQNLKQENEKFEPDKLTEEDNTCHSSLRAYRSKRLQEEEDQGKERRAKLRAYRLKHNKKNEKIAEDHALRIQYLRAYRKRREQKEINAETKKIDVVAAQKAVQNISKVPEASKFSAVEVKRQNAEEKVIWMRMSHQEKLKNAQNQEKIKNEPDADINTDNVKDVKLNNVAEVQKTSPGEENKASSEEINKKSAVENPRPKARTVEVKKSVPKKRKRPKPKDDYVKRRRGRKRKRKAPIRKPVNISAKSNHASEDSEIYFISEEVDINPKLELDRQNIPVVSNDVIEIASSDSDSVEEVYCLPPILSLSKPPLQKIESGYSSPPRLSPVPFSYAKANSNTPSPLNKKRPVLPVLTSNPFESVDEKMPMVTLLGCDVPLGANSGYTKPNVSPLESTSSEKVSLRNVRIKAEKPKEIKSEPQAGLESLRNPPILQLEEDIPAPEASPPTIPIRLNSIDRPVTKSEVLARLHEIRQEILSLNRKRLAQQIKAENENLSKRSNNILFNLICEERAKQKEFEELKTLYREIDNDLDY